MYAPGSSIVTSYFSVSKSGREKRSIEPELVGMRKTAVGEPEILVESPGIGHQRVALPFSHGTAVVQRIVVIAPDLTRVPAAIHLDDPIVAVAAADQDENPLPVAVFDKLHAVGQAGTAAVRPAACS